jgi:hypothetical protein
MILVMKCCHHHQVHTPQILLWRIELDQKVCEQSSDRMEVTFSAAKNTTAHAQSSKSAAIVRPTGNTLQTFG